MSNLAPHVARFFDGLEMLEDVERGHSFKAYVRESVRAFLDDETPANAFGVYQAFFDAYRITMEGEANPFLDLVDVLRSYEETAATLIDKQRDHYVHAVNVFLTGLAVWAENPHLRAAFDAAVPEPGYVHAYQTRWEEFFYRWGIASLFHDVGYPVEIVGHQINRFIRMVTDADGDEVCVRAQIRYENFGELNHIREVVPKRAFTREYYDAYESCSYIDLLTPLDLMAHRIHRAYGCDLTQVKAALDGFVDQMASSGFVDHGYYSALIVLKWYGHVIQRAGHEPAYLFWPVLDAATAILLHNWYRNGLTREPFSLGPMHASDNPIAWLLILCDELQEWNRTARGIVTRTFTLAETAHLSLTEDYLAATYVTRRAKLPEGFCAEKVELLRGLLALDEVFPAGFVVDNESLAALTPLGERLERASARPLLRDVELLAIAIHANYNERLLERYPDTPLDYPNFSDLPDDLKYSNMRQAQGIFERVRHAGYALRPQGGEGALDELPPEVVDALAHVEHDDWVAERLASGWRPGPRDAEARTSPYLVDYDELPDEVKELDRDAVRNIPLLARQIGMSVYAL